MIRCTCCQAEITCPQWHNGNPYGYTCIKKVSDQKRFKVEYKPCESFRIIGDTSVSTRVEVIFVLDGVKHRKPFYLTPELEIHNSQGFIQEGVLYIPCSKK